MSTKVHIYSYSRCATCRKALSWLEANKIEYELLDIVETPPRLETLQKAFNQLGSRKPLFNTSGMSYRALGGEVVRSMSDQEALNALVGDGKLVKRPFLITTQGKILIGFKPEIWAESLLY